jgi:uncharacterized protein YunC (DUF1805 family)
MDDGDVAAEAVGVRLLDEVVEVRFDEVSWECE